MKYLFAFIIFLSFNLNSQDSYPTYKLNGLSLYQIDTMMNNGSWEYDYGNILELFYEGERMTFNQVTVLYFGAVLDREYGPYKTMSMENEVHNLNNMNLYSEAISLSDTILKTRPTSLMALMERSFALRKERDSVKSVMASVQLRTLKEIILNSGDGLSPETAFIVTSRKDVDVINAHNRYFVMKAKEKLIDGVYYIEYTANVKGEKKKIYYNIDLVRRFGMP